MQGKIVDAMGFAINPVIPNRPIALEVDQARLREFRRWLLVFLVLSAAVCFDGWQRSGLRSHGYDIETLRRERAAEETDARNLRLELEVLRAPDRIERLATRQLHLVAPGPDEALIIERVVPPDQPPSSVVAAR